MSARPDHQPARKETGGSIDVWKQSFKRQQEIDRLMKPLVDGGMRADEAYMRVTCQIEWEEREAHQQRLLADIRENGT